jgi:hypothetical protein
MDNNVGYDQKTWGWDAGTGQSNFGGNRNRLGEAIRRVANIGTLLRIDDTTVSSHCLCCRLLVCRRCSGFPFASLTSVVALTERG